MTNMNSLFIGLNEIVRRADEPRARVTLSDITITTPYPLSREYKWGEATSTYYEDFILDENDDEVYDVTEITSTGEARMECFAWDIRYDSKVSESRLGYNGKVPTILTVDNLTIATVVHYSEYYRPINSKQWAVRVDRYDLFLY